MKKVLLGLLALSAVSMAAAPNLGADATAETNIFQSGQEGGISVTGTVITSDIPVVKYVVYASDDEGTTKEDTLMLSDFLLSQNADVVGYTTLNPKVYVKRVTGETGKEAYVDLKKEDVVKFALGTEHARVIINSCIKRNY